jgi:solute carrier family 13 (sodium-dependent dicarboxylate transporter), member 2/3/5
MSTQVVTRPVALEHGSEMSLRTYIGRALCIVIPVFLWFGPINVAPAARHALAISSFMIVAWITEAMEYAVTGLVGCYLFWALGIVDFGVAFSGFATDTPWFLLGAILFGTMATKSGLARRVAFAIMRFVGNTYSQILLGLLIADVVLAFVVPSGVALLVIMASVALGFIEAFGVAKGSNTARGMFIVLTYAAGLFDKMIIAGASTVTAQGILERVGGIHVTYVQWFLAYLPCSLITIFVTWRIALWLFPPENEQLGGDGSYVRDEIRKMGPWTSIEKKTEFFMLLAMALWFTDHLHKDITASMIGLGIGLLALIPGLGVLSVEDLKKVNYLPVFFVATAVSMGTVLVQTKGLNILANLMFAWMGPLLNNVFTATLVLYWTAFVYHFFLGSEISMLATSLPLLLNFAKTHGLNAQQLGMIWSFAAGPKIFVYQSGVMVVGYSYGYFQGKDLLRIGFLLTLLQAILLLILVPFYWPLIGIR